MLALGERFDITESGLGKVVVQVDSKLGAGKLASFPGSAIRNPSESG